METTKTTIEKTGINWFLFKSYKMFKKAIKYTLYILMIYALYSGFEWMLGF